MPYKKGQSGNPNGRPKGSTNTDTSLVKEVYSHIINSNLENVNDWIQEGGNTNPLQAIKLILKISDYVLPKLSRTRYTVDSSVTETVKFQFGEVQNL